MSTTLSWDLVAHDHASSTFGKMSHSIDESGRASERAAKMYDRLKKVGEFLAVAEGLHMVADAAIDVVKAAAEDQKAQRVLALNAEHAAHATHDQVESMQSWIEAQGRAKGVMLSELRPAMGRLIVATHDMGKAQHLTSLAMDISAGTGKNLTTVSTALAKAQTGSLGGLSRLGIATKNQAGKTLTLQQVTTKLAQTYRGDAAKAANTATGQMDRLKVAWEEGKVALGNKLLPIVGKFGSFLLDKVVPAVEAWGQKMGRELSPVIRSVGHWISGSLVPAIQKVAHWIQTQLIPQATKLARSVMPQVKKTVHDVAQGFHSAGPFIQSTGHILKGIWTVTKTFLIPILEYLIKHQLKNLGVEFRILGFALGVLGKAAMAMWNNFWAPVFRFITRGVAVVMKTWSNMLRVLSHVPGFGWAADAATKLSRAADASWRFANSIKAIPTSHTTTVTTHYVVTHSSSGVIHSSGGGHTAPGTASGGWARKGMPRYIGEHGRELWVPSESGRILPHSRVMGSEFAGIHSSNPTRVVTINAPIHIDGAQDPRATAQELRREFLRLRRELGGVGLGFD